MAKISTRLGRIHRVTNTNAKAFSHESSSYFAIWTKNFDGTTPRCLLFTDAEIQKAIMRSEKNKEDHTDRSFISRLLD